MTRDLSSIRGRPYLSVGTYYLQYNKSPMNSFKIVIPMNLIARKVLYPALLISLIYFNACSPPSKESDNLIVRENALEGSLDWQLTKVRTDTCGITEPFVETTFCRTKDIEGYVSHTSILPGETLEFFISTDPVDSFRLSVYRLGYYGGMGGRLVKEMGIFAGKVQPTPEDGDNNLIECQWESDLSLVIPEDWLSGVYLGKLTTLQEGWQSHVIFIVRDEREADLMFQCSDLTWQSYNRWPAWRSSYDGEADWGYTPWYTGAGPEVGFDRPYTFYMNHLPVYLDASVNGSGEFLLWEFPLAFWLEKNGYDVTYISNLDTHREGKKLLRAKAFLSVGHDEYWTREMYNHVTAARDSGMNILFLGGNSLSGEIYLKPSNAGVADRVFGRIERFRDEDLLMGAKSYGVGLADWICTAPDHWMFAGTDMKEGDRIPDLVGWEFHGYPLPAIEGLVVVAEGSLAGAEEDHRYAATYYEGPRGNFIFNAATCWWSMPLSSPPGFAYPHNYRKYFTDHDIDFRKEDIRVQQITRNLLDRAIEMNINQAP